MPYNATLRQGMKLSAREVECLVSRLTHCNKEVADDLGISLTTVKNHFSNIYIKLGVDNIVQAYVVLGWLSGPRSHPQIPTEYLLGYALT
jgi:DNA-binding CsgD family transcriptional regulator